MLSSGLTVSVTGVGCITKKKIELYRGLSNVQLFFVDKPDMNRSVCVLPVEMLPEFFSTDKISLSLKPPVIGFGPPDAMSLSIASGCVDYLCNPWSPEELFARLSRCFFIVSFQYQNLYFLCEHGELICLTEDEHRYAVKISKSESLLLKLFSRNQGYYFSRQTLSEVLSCGNDNDSRSVDMYISRLRKKISELCSAAGIQSADSPVRTSSGRGWGIS